MKTHDQKHNMNTIIRRKKNIIGKAINAHLVCMNTLEKT